MKKHPLLLLALALGLVVSVRAQNPAAPAPAAAKSQADLDYDATYAIWREQPSDPELRKTDPKAFFRFQDDHMRRFSEAARVFAAKYPGDPRRYEAVVQSSFTRPWFLTGFKPEFDAVPTEGNLIVDQPALNAWWESQLKLLAEIIESPASTMRQRGGAMYCFLIDSRSLARAKGETFDVESAGPLVGRALAKAPADTLLPVAEQYLGALKNAKRDAAVEAFEAKLKSYPEITAAIAAADAKRAEAAAEKTKKLTALTAMKFTAADGREVEIAKLKGKVVLIDFWATWCGPCKAEIPNVVANYNKYHDKGFEVIGVTLENPDFKPKDTDEQKTAKLAKAKQVMLEFTAKAGMAWPQYYDGKWWKNDYAVQFGVDSIPAMFLLDQNGNIVSQEARGPKLEAEIKRLLKL